MKQSLDDLLAGQGKSVLLSTKMYIPGRPPQTGRRDECTHQTTVEVGCACPYWYADVYRGSFVLSAE